MKIHPFTPKILLLSAIFLLLTACATQPASHAPLNESLPWATRVTQLQAITQWTLMGAVTLNTPKERTTASLNWKQNNQHYTLILFGPLGMGSLELQGKPGTVILKSAGKPTRQATTPEALMKEALGWSLPVRNLYYWVRGLPAPHVPATKTFDAYHHLTKLRQQGWTIKYLRYTAVNGIDLPSKISLQTPRIGAKITIAHWQLPAPSGKYY